MVEFDSGPSFVDQLGVLSSNWTMMYVPVCVAYLGSPFSLRGTWFSCGSEP
jgi:hypothetical protein